MASILLQSKVALSSLIEEPTYYLNRITPRKVFKDGKATDDILGYVYTVTNTETYQQIDVLVEQKEALIDQTALEQMQENGEKLFVEFDAAYIKPYYSTKTKSVEDSIRAKAVSVIESD